MPLQRFELDRKYLILMKACLGICLGGIVLVISLSLILNNSSEKNTSGQTFLGIILCSLLFGGCAFFAYHIIKKLPYVNIKIDDDGLWYSHLPKEQSCVSWKAINQIKERVYLQCLDLFDLHGKHLLRIEYQLNRFEDLRGLLCEAIIKNRQHVSLPITFSKSMWYHVLYVCSIIGSFCLGWGIVISNGPWLLSVGMLIAVLGILYEYQTEVYQVTLSEKGITMMFPFTNVTINWNNILSSKLVDIFYNGWRRPEVWVSTLNRRYPFKLKQLEVGSIELYVVLQSVCSRINPSKDVLAGDFAEGAE